MPILVYSVPIGALLLFLWIAWKAYLSKIPAVRAWLKLDEIETTADVASKVKEVDVDKSKKDSKTVNNFIKE